MLSWALIFSGPTPENFVYLIDGWPDYINALPANRFAWLRQTRPILPFQWEIPNGTPHVSTGRQCQNEKRAAGECVCLIGSETSILFVKNKGRVGRKEWRITLRYELTRHARPRAGHPDVDGTAVHF